MKGVESPTTGSPTDSSRSFSKVRRRDTLAALRCRICANSYGCRPFVLSAFFRFFAFAPRTDWVTGLIDSFVKERFKPVRAQTTDNSAHDQAHHLIHQGTESILTTKWLHAGINGYSWRHPSHRLCCCRLSMFLEILERLIELLRSCPPARRNAELHALRALANNPHKNQSVNPPWESQAPLPQKDAAASIVPFVVLDFLASWNTCQTIDILIRLLVPV